ncbi:hypothetical protein ACLOJK_007841 [Asimina triloba]
MQIGVVTVGGIRVDPQQSKNGSVSSYDAGAQGGWIVISHIARSEQYLSSVAMGRYKWHQSFIFFIRF